MLFDTFRSGTAPRTGSRGLGLGLYITRQIVHAHGGENRGAVGHVEGDGGLGRSAEAAEPRGRRGAAAAGGLTARCVRQRTRTRERKRKRRELPLPFAFAFTFTTAHALLAYARVRRVCIAAFAAAACTHAQMPGAPGGVDAGVLSPDALVPPWRAPLGAHWDPTGSEVVFRVASTRATRVELDLFDAARRRRRASRRSRWIATATRRSWTARVAAADLPADDLLRLSRVGPELAVRPGVDAGLATPAGSPTSTRDGNRMNPNKLVFDPYARELSHDPHDAGAAPTATRVRGRHAHRDVDSAPVAPKGIVLRDADAGDFGAQPTRALARRRHLRGPRARLHRGRPGGRRVRGHVRRRRDARAAISRRSASPRSS